LCCGDGDIVGQIHLVFGFEFLKNLDSLHIFLNAVCEFKNKRFSLKAVFEVILHGLPGSFVQFLLEDHEHFFLGAELLDEAEDVFRLVFVRGSGPGRPQGIGGSVMILVRMVLVRHDSTPAQQDRPGVKDVVPHTGQVL